ncbi:pyruvate dehydrogenase [Frankia sp. AgB32]|uniref:pyruvate dehydrogenase n=1 Tax=Frankia sp. AgB32 TaxID=631119 RepID=UPI0027E3A0BB|nr:pyruvate dehydrogenase [Frankia sp. AgB32]
MTIGPDDAGPDSALSAGIPLDGSPLDGTTHDGTTHDGTADASRDAPTSDGAIRHDDAADDRVPERTAPRDTSSPYPGRDDAMVTPTIARSSPSGATAQAAGLPNGHQVPPGDVDGAPVPGPPGGVLDLAALATLDERLRVAAAGIIGAGVRSGRRSAAAARRDRAGAAAAASVATVLWFDALRAEDRVSVTPHAASLVLAVHQVLEDARAADGADGAARPGTTLDAWSRPDAAPNPGPLRMLGAGNVGPSGTVWAALARRFAGERFDLAPRGRQICLVDFAELRDPAVWETITDERVAHLGELFWVVTVAGGGIAAGGAAGPGGEAARGVGGPGGVGGPARAARMFEAAGWQVLSVRFGRRLAALLERPGGHALRARLDQLTPAQYRELLHARGTELRRQLAGPGATGVGISRLLDTLSDEEILACLCDLGGHDIPLLIDAFDEVVADRPTVLFAYTDDRLTPDDEPRPDEVPTADELTADQRAADERAADELAADELAAGRLAGGEPPHVGALGAPAGREPGVVAAADGAVALRPGRADLEPLPWSSGARRLARHVARYLDRAPVAARAPARVPAQAGRAFPNWISTQDAFGALLRDLPGLAPHATAAVVTISTRAADPVLAGWLAAAGRSSADPGTAPEPAAPRPLPPAGGDAGHASPINHTGSSGSSGHGGDTGQAGATADGRPSGRHVAGGLSAAAFGGVLGSLGVAWSRQGLPLLPIGVADEASAGRMLPGWLAACEADARSVLAVADTGFEPAARALVWSGGEGVPTAVAATWQPAFAADLAWCLLAGLGRLARLDGAASLIRLSARPVDQRLAELPVDPDGLRRRQALVLAGGYRLHDGGPGAVVTLVGVGPVMPEVLDAAARLRAGLRREVSVVCLTSPNAVFHALQARRGLAEGSDALLAELFPAQRRGPIVTVVDGDPRTLSFLAGVHGDPISTLGSAAPPPGTAPPTGPAAAPVPVDTIIGTALDLVDEAAQG